MIVPTKHTNMSLAAEENSSAKKGWFRKGKPWIIAAVLLLLLASGAVILIVSSNPVPEIGGGLMIEADPGTRIYAGDKRVGTTRMTFSWAELFGDEKAYSTGRGAVRPGAIDNGGDAFGAGR